MMSHPLAVKRSAPASAASSTQPPPTASGLAAASFAANSVEWTAALLSSHSVLEYHHKHQLYPTSAQPSSSSLPASSPLALSRQPSLRRSESEIQRGDDDADAAGQRNRSRQASSSSLTDDTASDDTNDAAAVRDDVELYAAMQAWSPAAAGSGLSWSMFRTPMYRRWVDTLSSFSLASSSFGCLLDKRLLMLTDLITAATVTKPPLSPAHKDGKKSNIPPPPPANQPQSHSTHNTSQSDLSSPVWPTLKGLDTESWPEGFDLLVGQLESVGGLQLMNECTPHEEIEELFARVLSYIDVSSLSSTASDATVSEAVAVSGVSALLAVAVSRASPQHVLQCIVTLLQMKHMRFADTINPFLSTLASHLSEFDISAPFQLSALQSFTITTPSPSTATSSYAARSPALALTASPSHLFIHSACGLLKIGTGYSGSIHNHHYLHSSYRQHELLSFAYIHSLNTLFVSATHFSFPRLQLLDADTLKPKDYVILGLGGDSGAMVRGYGQLLSDGRWLYVVEVSEAVKVEDRKEEKEKEGKESEAKETEQQAAEKDEGALEEERRTAQKALQESVIEIERWLKQKRRDGLDAAAVLVEQSEELDKKQRKVETRITVMREIRQRMGLTDEKRADRRDDTEGAPPHSAPPPSSASEQPTLLTYLAEAKDLLAMARKEHRLQIHQKRKKDNGTSTAQPTRVASSAANADKKQYTFTLCKYDPLLQLSANQSYSEPPPVNESEQQRQVRQQRQEKAEQMSDAFSYYYSPALCTLALRKNSEDVNSACRWLLENGEEWRQHKRCPLVARIVLESDDTLASFSPDLLAKFEPLVTPHQLVLTVPAHISSLTHDDDSLTRVYDIQSGRLICEHSGQVGKQNQQAVYDSVNDVIWTVNPHGVNQMEATVYRNHGPTHSPSLATRPIPTADDVLASLSLPSDSAPADRVALFLLAHMDRHLRHADVTPLRRPPLLDLNARLEALRESCEAEAKEQVQLKAQVSALEKKEREQKNDISPESSREREVRERDRDRDRDQQRERELDDNELHDILAASDGVTGSIGGGSALSLSAAAHVIPAASALLQFIQADDRAHSLDFNALLNRIVASDRGAFGGLQVSASGSSLASAPAAVASPSASAQALGISSSATSSPPSSSSPLFHLTRLKRGPTRSSTREQLSNRVNDSSDRLVRLRAEMDEVEEQIKEANERNQHSAFVPEAGTLPYCLELEDQTFSLLYEIVDMHVKRMEEPGERSEVDKEAANTLSFSPAAVSAYYISVCLSLLQVHLETLLADCPADSYPVITHLHPIRSLLLHLALSSSPTLSHIPDALRHSAISALISGLRIFYPTQHDRTLLLSELMAAGKQPDSQRTQEFLKGVLAWFAEEKDVSDTLLVRKGAGAGDGSEQSVRFIEVLVEFAREEFTAQREQAERLAAGAQLSPPVPITKRAMSKSNSLPNVSLRKTMSFSSGGSSSNTANLAAGKLSSDVTALAPSPSLRLLLILLMDLIAKSGLLSTDSSASATASNLKPLIPPTSSAAASRVPIPPSVYLQHLLEFAQVVLRSCDELVSTLAAHVSAVTDSPPPPLPLLTEQLKNSILLLITPLLTALSSQYLLASTTHVQTVLPLITSLLVHIDSFNALFPSHVASDSTYSLQLAGEVTRSHLIESPHPYPSGPRMVEQTVTIPGATSIAWTFDPRSASHNGSDALRYYYDREMKYGMAVGPFFGNERDSSSSWPRTTIITPGNTATVCFSAKSPPKRDSDRGGSGGGGGSGNAGRGGRGDEQRWGFRMIARGVIIRSLPWLLDLENQIAALAGRMVSVMIGGVRRDAREMRLKPYLSLPLLNSGLEAASPTATAAGRLTAASLPSDEVTAFLVSFVEGGELATALLTEMERHSVSFPGKQVVRRLPTDVRTAWDRSLRSLMAAMIKHTGLAADVHHQYGGAGQGKPASDLLVERLKFVAVSAKSMQNWMIEQVQLHGEFDSWLEAGKMNAIYVHKHSSQVTFDDSKRAASGSGDQKETEGKRDKPEPQTVARDASLDDKELCYDLTFTVAELKSEYASQPAKVKQLATLKRVPLKRIADHRVNTAQHSKFDPFTVSTSATSSSPLLSPALTPVTTPMASQSPSIGSVTVGVGSSSTISFDVDHAVEELYKVIESERAARQREARQRPEEAYHLLDLKERKLRTYKLVVQQVADMGMGLLRFQCNEKLSTTLPSVLKPSSSSSLGSRSSRAASSSHVSSIEGFSLDAPANTPSFGRAHTDAPEEISPPTSILLTLAHTQSTIVQPDRPIGVFAPSPPPASLSAPLQSRVNDLRSWIDSYQRFRSWQNANLPFTSAASMQASSTSLPNTLSKQSSPVDGIKLLLRENIDPIALLDVATLHTTRADGRQRGLDFLYRLLERNSVSFEVGRVELVGLLVDSIEAMEGDVMSGSGGEEESDAVSLFTGIECATMAAKDAVRERYEHFALSLLTLLRQPLVSTAALKNKVSLSSSSSAASPLQSSASLSTSTRLNYASRLLALADVYSFPFVPLLSANMLSAPCSSLLSQHGPLLFQVLSDAVAMKRLMHGIELAIRKEARRKDERIMQTIEQTEQQAKETAAIEQQLERYKQQQQQEKAAGRQQQRQDEAADLTAFWNDEPLSDFFAILGPSVLERQPSGENQLRVEQVGVAAGAEAAAESEVEADGREMCQYGERCYRKNPAHFLEFRHPPRVEQQPPQSQPQPPTQSAAAEQKETESEDSKKVEEDSASEQVAAALQAREGNQDQDEQSDESEMQDKLQALVNRMGHSMKRGVGRSRSKREDEQRRAKDKRIWRQMSAQDRERNRRAIGAGGVGGAAGTGWLDEEENEEDEREGDIPSCEYVESILSSHQYAGLRIVMLQLASYDPPRIRTALSQQANTEKAVASEVKRSSQLASLVHAVLSKEMMHAAAMACELYDREVGWAIRRKVLDSVDKILSFYILLFAHTTSALSPFTSSPLAAPHTRTLATTLLTIAHHYAAFTPHIVRMALRLARRVFPSLSPRALFASFQPILQQEGMERRRQQAALVEATEATEYVDGLSGYLLSLIGSLLTERMDEMEKTRKQERQRKRVERIKRDRHKRQTEERERQAKEAADKQQKQPTDLNLAGATPVTSVTASSSTAEEKVNTLPLPTHSVLIHYSENVTSEWWSTLLSNPAYVDLLYGHMGAIAPPPETIAAATIEAFNRRQLGRKGSSRVSMYSKTGMVDISSEQRATCRAGFSTVIGNVTVTSGRWFYQVQLNTRGLMQIGWCTAQHSPNSSSGDGCGDDAHSWSYDGMRLKKWHSGNHAYSSTRWNVGDIVGCSIDCDADAGAEMRFYLNGEDLGVAFRHVSIGAGIMPAASLSHGESCTFIFDSNKMRRVGPAKSKMPDGFYPLENDRADSADPVNIRRAGDIMRGLEYDGVFPLIEADYEYCVIVAEMLADEGVVVSVGRVEDEGTVDVLEANAVSEGAGVDDSLDTMQLWTGKAVHDLTSELIALSRHLLLSSASSFSSSFKQHLQSAITMSSYPSHLTLAALAVLGSFDESIRVGGTVTLSNASTARGVVVSYNNADDNVFARVLMLSDVMAERQTQAANPAQAQAPLQAHRIKLADLTPVPEYFIDLHTFPLTDEIYQALKQRIEAPTSDTKVVRLVQYGSVQLLASLLSNSPSLHSLSVGMLTSITTLLLAHAQSVSQGLQLDLIRRTCVKLHVRHWELVSGVDEINNTLPFKSTRRTATPAATSSPTSASSPSSSDFIYASSSYSDPSLLSSSAQDDSMLRYWEKHIIPLIQNYVRASFRPYEMENFFAQLRQPLKQNNNSAAVEIALTLCGGHVPEGVSLPDDGKDFSVLMMSDVEVGGRYEVSESVRNCDMWVEEMKGTVGRTGRAKVRHPAEELVLMQFVNEREGTIEEWWYGVEVLRKPARGGGGSGCGFEAVRDVHIVNEQLGVHEPLLSALLARRALFSLCSRSNSSSQSFLDSQLRHKGLDSVLDFIFLSASESLDLSSLSTLGQPVASSKEQMWLLQNNLGQFLQSAAVSSTELQSLVVSHVSRLLQQSASFTSFHASTHPFSVSAQATEPFVQRLSVSSACLLLLLFAKDCRLSTGSSLSLFADADMTDVVRVVVGKDEATGPLQPASVAGDSVWLHITKPNDVSTRGSVRVLPIPPSLALGVWLMDWLLGESMYWLVDDVAALCYQFAAAIMQHFQLSAMQPSPLKEALLRLLARLLSYIHAANQSQYSTAEKTRPQLSSESAVLLSLKGLKGEMVELYEKREQGAEVYSSYLQQLLDVLVSSDELRSTEDRLVSTFHFKLPLSEEEERKMKEEEERKKALEAAVSTWSCPTCTYANPLTHNACEMCGSPRPPKAVAKKADSKAADAMRGDDVMHHVAALMAAMRYLAGGMELDDSRAVRALMEYAHEEVRRDTIESRLVVIENVPVGPTAAVKASIIDAALSAVPNLHLLPSHLFLYTDPSKQPVAPLLRRTDSKGKREKEVHAFSFTRPFDDNGVLYHLGCAGHEGSWTNPHESKAVVCTSSSVDGTSSVKGIVSRFPTHFATKSAAKSWVGVELSNHTLQLSHYTLRNTDNSEVRNLSMRSWKLEGSRDGKQWTLLDERNHDSTLNQKSQTVTHAVPQSNTGSQYYSHFRLTQTAANSGGGQQLCMGGVEMYGRLRKKPVKGDAAVTPHVCVMELSVSDRKVRDKVLAALNGCEMLLLVREGMEDKTGEASEKKEQKEKEATATGGKEDEEEEEETELMSLGSEEDDEGWVSPSKRRGSKGRTSSKTERAAEKARRRELAEKEKKDREAKEREEEEREALANRFVQLKARHYTDVPASDSTIVYYMLSRVMKDVSSASTSVPSTFSAPSSPTSGSSPLHSAFVSAVNDIVTRFIQHNEPGVPRLSSKGVESVMSYGSLYAAPAPLLPLLKQLLTRVETDNGVPSSAMLDIFATVFAPSSVSKVSVSTLSSLLSSLFSWLNAAGFDLHLNPHSFPTIELAMSSQQSELWSAAGQEQLLSLLQDMVERTGDDSLLSFQPSQLVFDAGSINVELSRLPQPSQTLPALRLRFAFLRKFNSLLSQLLPLIDLRLPSFSSASSIAFASSSLPALIHRSKSFVFTSCKTTFLQLILAASAVDAKPPRIVLNRPALLLRKQRGEYIDFVKHSNFGNGFRQLIDTPAALLRPARPHGTEPFLGFEVEFQQEQVVGEGGPYRQYFSDVGRELVDQSPQSASPLFINCPNKQSQVGDNRDKYVINPAAGSSLHLQMYEFVGVLMGLCIRTGVRLPIDLPSFVWKPLVGDELSASDLYAIDANAGEYMKLIESYDGATLAGEIHQSFTTALSDQSIVELKPNGANELVTAANRQQYISLAIAARLSEHTQQLDAIRRGIARILPAQLLNVLSWRELAVLIAGKADIDVELLRRHTEYSGCSESSPHIRMFWQLLRSFDQHHRRLFIRFAWAQDRLPATDDEFNRAHVRFLIKPPTAPLHKHDQLLPRSDTCFFNAELPLYSSMEVMRDKVLYAITTCTDMNADQNVEDIHGRGGRGSVSSGGRGRYHDESEDY